jgi:hypothetical protein
MKYKKRYVEGITPKKKSKALSLGFCMASALNGFRQTGSKDEGIKFFTKAWEEDGQNLVLKKDDDSRRSVERGLEIFSNYVNNYPDEPNSIVQAEIKFEHQIAEGIIFNGRIDGVIRLSDGSLAIIEDKTTSRLGDSYFVRMKGSSQVLWYMWVANKLGLFCLNAKVQLPKCYINAIYIHDKTNRFERDITMKTEDTLELASENMLKWIHQIQKAERDDHFPLNDVDNSVCTAYGGCEYLPLKYAKKSQYDRLLNTEFNVSDRKSVGVFDEIEGEAE